MKQGKIIALILALFIGVSLSAQEKRTIKVIVPHKTDEVFITGNQKSLRDWIPNRIKMDKISDYERSVRVELDYPAEFKFTKGSWDTEGIIKKLNNNPNQKLSNSESKALFTIKGWSNDTLGEALGLDYNIKQFKSTYLKDERLIKIVIPDNYDPTKKYPVFYTTDGGGNIFDVAKHYLSDLSLEEYKLIPESILVGIVHGQTNGRSNRNKDLDIDYAQTGKNFKKFIFKELVPYINRTYSTSGFNVLIGHSNGAEYNHFLLLEEEVPFRGFISLSTNFFSKDVRQEMGDFMQKYQGNTLYYFLANAKQDSPDRIEAGNDYEKIYNSNANPRIQFKKFTYDANHNSVVPLALLDAIQFIFKDYRNIKKYENFEAYKTHYLKDMKSNYGIEEAYDRKDLEPILMDIILSKNKVALKEYLQFIEDNKLWQNHLMKEPGGLDAMNQGNMYFIINDFENSAKQYTKALGQLEITVEPPVYYYNFSKIEQSFMKLNRYDALMDILIKSRNALLSNSNYLGKNHKGMLMKLNYKIANLSKAHNLKTKEGKMALKYCKENYVANKLFTLEDLNNLF